MCPYRFRPAIADWSMGYARRCSFAKVRRRMDGGFMMIATACLSGTRLILRGFSTQWAIVAAISFLFLAALLRWKSLRRSRIFSEIIQTTFWGIVFAASLIHDDTGRFPAHNVWSVAPLVGLSSVP